jgi:formylglycine-generating enzyme required for sulfatase activity
MNGNARIVTFALAMALGAAGETWAPSIVRAQPGSAPASGPAMTLDLGNGVAMKLVRIPAGKFIMGSLVSVADRDGEVQHEVTISKPFYMGTYDVTVDQYAQFIKQTGQSHTDPSFPQTGDHPVVNVTWEDARAFCQWLAKKTGKSVDLPSEAQWEYACRAGSTSQYYFADDEAKLGDYAWFSGNNINATHPVGQKKPNAWGLYDMHGNVWQWCLDCFERDYPSTPATDPSGPTKDEKGANRVLRGGSFRSAPKGCRSARRAGFLSTNSDECFGFRVVVTAPDEN